MPDTSEEPTDLGLDKGSVVTSGKNKWIVDELLGEGGFGAVFRVYDPSAPNVNYAMKVEQKMEKRPDSKLKMEIAILKLVSSERTEKRSHFTKIMDRGKQEKFFFLVMQLVGKSLADLKFEQPTNVFSMGTGLGVSIQCLEAVEDLHKHDFLHRDIKPANFASGLGEMRRTIYILDFGIARKLTNDNNELKTPRIKVPFKGTVRFAALACHRNAEMSFKDDCESWFYMLLDLIRVGGLPWRKAAEKDEVMRLKQDARENKGHEMLKMFKCEKELWTIIDYIDHLTYTDRVDYGYLYSVLKLSMGTCKVTMDDPYDWEKGGDKKTAEDRGINPYDPLHDSQTQRTANRKDKSHIKEPKVKPEQNKSKVKK